MWERAREAKAIESALLWWGGVTAGLTDDAFQSSLVPIASAHVSRETRSVAFPQGSSIIGIKDPRRGPLAQRAAEPHGSWLFHVKRHA